MILLPRSAMTRAAVLLAVFLLACGPGDRPAYSLDGPRHTFTLSRDDFMLDGKPFRIIAGEMHFARIPREYWRHRLRMARAMGLNTVATYVFWNYHEPVEGSFDFTTESRDIAAFIRMAQEEGLWVIVRPGPYACAEWEFGGYPWWLLRDPALVVRGTDPDFLAASKRYLVRLGEEIAPLQVTRGGPIIMVQVENEYGSFGSDTTFMGAVRDDLIAAGFDVPLFTADGPSQCRAGHVRGVLPAINGDDNPASIRDTVSKYHGGAGPFFSPEFYPGWLDHWGEPHSVVPAAGLAVKLDALLAGGISVNLYMFHGGTNFGFTNGANFGGRYQPQPTSYDYDAPLDEAGRPTPKYFALRDVIGKHLPAGTVVPDPPPPLPVVSVPPFTPGESAELFDILPAPLASDRTLTMEQAGQGTGYILYRTNLPSSSAGELVVEGLRDYAVVYVDTRRAGALDRRHNQKTLTIPGGPAGRELDILVENGGRINYGRQMLDNRKGITGDVLLDGTPLRGWKIYPLPMTDLSGLKFSGRAAGGHPSFHRGTFSLANTGDTFLDLRGWEKGCVWVNGHNLGRYWDIGPQQTLYCPGAWLRQGTNEVVVFDIGEGPVAPLGGLTSPLLDSLGFDRLAPPPPVREPGPFVRDAADRVLQGEFARGDSAQEFRFHAVPARYVCLEALSSLDGDPFSSASEVYLLDARGGRIDRRGWKIVWVDSEELTAEDGRAENAVDGDPGTIWHTQWGSAQPGQPHALVVDLGGVVDVSGFVYRPRPGNAPGKIRAFNVYLRGEPFRKTGP